MLKKMIVLVAATLPLVCAQTETVTYSYSGPPLPISFSPSEFAVASILVPRALRVSKVTVRVQIDYPEVGDLNVYFYSAEGTRTRLLEKNCGSLKNVDTTFDDDAETRFSSFCPAEAGRGPFQGNEPLANSNNEISLGTWHLAVQNNGSASRSGQLRTFSITITGTPITGPIFNRETIVSSASGQTGFIAPGELVDIYGSGLGPTDPVAAPAGNLPTTLGGTTVVMDGITVPIAYSSNSLLRIQVPFDEIPGTLALLQVGYNDQASVVIATPVRLAAPAIYTTGESGNQAKAVNEDGNLNSSDDPAARGSYVAFYATGLGLTDPLLAVGSVAPTGTLFNTAFPIAVYIGGYSASVQFAGLAPGLTGIYQVNIQIPTELAAGTHEIAIVARNGAVSQPNVFLDVK